MFYFRSHILYIILIIIVFATTIIYGRKCPLANPQATRKGFYSTGICTLAYLRVRQHPEQEGRQETLANNMLCRVLEFKQTGTIRMLKIVCAF